MKKALTTIKRFRNAHEAMENDLKSYMTTKRGRAYLSQEAVENLRDRSSMLLKATNPRARVVLATTADWKFNAFLSRQNAPNQLFWITIVSKQMCYPVIHASYFCAPKVADILANLFRDVSYFGMIDVAFYGNHSTPTPGVSPYSTHARTLSFHIHLLAWGDSEDYFRGMRVALNRCLEPMLLDKPPFFVRAVTKEQARQKTTYLLKMPLKEYRIWLKRTESDFADQSTGEIVSRVVRRTKVKKRPLRPGDAARLYSALADRRLDELLVAGGEGQDLRDEILQVCRGRLEFVYRAKQALLTSGMAPSGETDP